MSNVHQSKVTTIWEYNWSDADAHLAKQDSFKSEGQDEFGKPLKCNPFLTCIEGAPVIKNPLFALAEAGQVSRSPSMRRSSRRASSRRKITRETKAGCYPESDVKLVVPTSIDWSDKVNYRPKTYTGP